MVVLAGRTRNNDETTFGIVLVKVANEAAARTLMENDPFVKDRVASGETVAVTPRLHCRKVARPAVALFASV
jgi:uncharacterized protein YciI